MVSELVRIFQEIVQYHDTLDENAREELESIGDKVVEYVMDNVNSVYEFTSQEDVDKITGQYKGNTAQFKNKNNF